MIPRADAYETEQVEANGLRDERDALRAALTELVALNDMKNEMSHMLLREEGGMGIDYDRRKPIAWQRARELVGSNAEVTGGPLAARPVD